MLTGVHPVSAALPSALVALDFDGTLAPVSPHPDDARPAAGARQLLRDLRATGTAVAVITGRSVDSLLRVSGFGAVPGIVLYGLHGAERWQAGRLRTLDTPPGIYDLRLRLPGLVTSIAPDPAIWIEDKRLSLVVHTRLTAEPDRLLARLRAPVTEAADAAGLQVRSGREVLEICIPGIDKGSAIRELISSETAAAFYAGDDTGDLPAIRELNAWSGRSGRPKLAVAVSPPGSPSGSPSGSGPLAGHADLTVPDPHSLILLLRQIIENAAADR